MSQEAALLQEIAGLAALINGHKSYKPPSRTYYPGSHTQPHGAPPAQKPRFANMTLTKPTTIPPQPPLPAQPRPQPQPPSVSQLPKPVFPSKPQPIPTTVRTPPKPKYANKKLVLNATSSSPTKAIAPAPAIVPVNSAPTPSKVKNSYIRRGNKLVRKSTTFLSKGVTNTPYTPRNLYSTTPTAPTTYSPSVYIKYRMALIRASQIKQNPTLSRRYSITKKSPIRLSLTKKSPLKLSTGNTYVRRGGNKLVRNSLKYVRATTPSKPPATNQPIGMLLQLIS